MKITFIQTGGTIDKDYPRLDSYAFEITEPAVKRILSQLNINFTSEFITAFKKDSLDITQADRKKLFNIIKKIKNNKIIITHGTDTLVATAKYLQNIKDKTIVLTGSLQPERFIHSDAVFNVGTAVGAINVLKPGVYVAMSGKIFNADNCKKDLKTGKFVEIE